MIINMLKNRIFIRNITSSLTKLKLCNIRTHERFKLICFKIRDFSTNSAMLKEIRFHTKHEWCSLEDRIATIGISDYAQNALGTIVYVQLPDLNIEVNKDDEISCVESTKSASDIYSPLSGKVIEVNEELTENPSYINTSCYDKGWIYKLEVKNDNEFKELMTQEEYKNFLKSIED